MTKTHHRWQTNLKLQKTESIELLESFLNTAKGKTGIWSNRCEMIHLRWDQEKILDKIRSRANSQI